MELLNDNDIKKKLIHSYAHHVREDPTGKQVVGIYSHRSGNTNKLEDDDIINAPVKSKHRWEATYLQQLSILTERTFKQRRGIILSNIDVAHTLGMALLCCLVWYQIPFKEEHISDRFGSVSIISFSFSFLVLILINFFLIPDLYYNDLYRFSSRKYQNNFY